METPQKVPLPAKPANGAKEGVARKSVTQNVAKQQCDNVLQAENGMLQGGADGMPQHGAEGVDLVEWVLFHAPVCARKLISEYQA